MNLRITEDGFQFGGTEGLRPAARHDSARVAVRALLNDDLVGPERRSPGRLGWAGRSFVDADAACRPGLRFGGTGVTGPHPGPGGTSRSKDARPPPRPCVSARRHFGGRPGSGSRCVSNRGRRFIQGDGAWPESRPRACPTTPRTGHDQVLSTTVIPAFHVACEACLCTRARCCRRRTGVDARRRRRGGARTSSGIAPIRATPGDRTTTPLPVGGASLTSAGFCLRLLVAAGEVELDSPDPARDRGPPRPPPGDRDLLLQRATAGSTFFASLTQARSVWGLASLLLRSSLTLVLPASMSRRPGSVKEWAGSGQGPREADVGKPSAPGKPVLFGGVGVDRGVTELKVKHASEFVRETARTRFFRAAWASVSV